MAKAEEKLRPCQCGGEARVNITPNRGEFYVICENEDIEQAKLYLTESEAITAWNHRPVEDELLGALVEIRQGPDSSKPLSRKEMIEIATQAIKAGGGE